MAEERLAVITIWLLHERLLKSPDNPSETIQYLCAVLELALFDINPANPIASSQYEPGRIECGNGSQFFR